MITEDIISQLKSIAASSMSNLREGMSHQCNRQSAIILAAVCVLEAGGEEFDAQALRILWVGKKAFGDSAMFIQQAMDLLVEAIGMEPLKILVETRGGVVDGVYLSEPIPGVKVDILDWDDDESQTNEAAICARRDKMTKVF